MAHQMRPMATHWHRPVRMLLLESLDGLVRRHAAAASTWLGRAQVLLFHTTTNRRRRYLAAHSPPPTAPFSPVCDTPGAAAAHRHVADAHLHRGAHGRKPAGTRARPSPLAPLARPLARPSRNPNPRPVLVALTFTLPPPRPHPPALVHAPRRASSSRGVASAPGPSQRRARCPRWARQPRRRLTRSRSTRGPPAVEPQLRAPGAARARRLRRPRRPSCATALL